MTRRRAQRKGYVFSRVREDGSASWWIQFREDFLAADGSLQRRKRRELLGDATGPDRLTKRQAEDRAQEVLVALNLRSRRPATLASLREFVEAKFVPQVVWTKKPGGQEHYNTILNAHVKPGLGPLALRDISLEDVQQLLKDKIEREKLSVQTAVHIRNVISAIFEHAIRLGLWNGSKPTDGVVLPRMVRKERRALSGEQAAALVAALGAPSRQVAFLLLCTGLRIGEAMGLKWGRVDWENGVLRIEESYRRGVWSDLKTTASRRIVPLPLAVSTELRAWFAITTRTGADDPVFSDAAGVPLKPRTLFTPVRSVAKGLGLAEITWHWFRHTASTLAESAGATVSDRQKILGHSDGAMTMHYTHEDLARMRGTLDKVAALVGNPPGRIM